jgi:dipeptidyl aminopeptidase/acylaminoacyl peptidase
MSDVRAILERGYASAMPPPDGFERMLRRRDRKRRNKRIRASVVGIAVFVAAVWIVRDIASLDRARPATHPTQTPSQPTQTPVSAGPVPETDYLLDLGSGEMTPLPKSIANTQDRTSDYAVSPDGSRLAFVAPGDDGNRELFVANLDGTGVEQVTNDLAASTPAWSPNGSKIAYVARRNHEPEDIFVLDLATGTSTQITFEKQGADSPSFSPDGSSIVYGGHGEVWIVPIAGGESVRLVGGHSVEASDPQLSPDGSLLSYGCSPPVGYPQALCLANADGTDARELGQGDDVVSARWSPDGTRIAYWQLHSLDVFVVHVATGEETNVGHGASPAWIDDHTLILKADRCPGPQSEGCGG